MIAKHDSICWQIILHQLFCVNHSIIYTQKSLLEIRYLASWEFDFARRIGKNTILMVFTTGLASSQSSKIYIISTHPIESSRAIRRIAHIHANIVHLLYVYVLVSNKYCNSHSTTMSINTYVKWGERDGGAQGGIHCVCLYTHICIVCV